MQEMLPGHAHFIV